eukprot:scaffold10079_cov61-Phaeocystis_antarctica.AAC.3
MAVKRPHAVESEAATRRRRTEHRRFCRLVSGESEGSSPERAMLARCSRTASLPSVCCGGGVGGGGVRMCAHVCASVCTCVCVCVRARVRVCVPRRDQRGAHPAVDPRVELYDEVLGGALWDLPIVTRLAEVGAHRHGAREAEGGGLRDAQHGIAERRDQ